MELRHSHKDASLHYANIPYGYYTVSICVLHIALSVLTHWARSKGFRLSVPLWVIVPVYAIGLTALCFHHLDFDTQIATILKRFGRLAFAMVPFNVLLALRPAGWQYISFGYYLDYINLHKWISRIILGLSMFHGLGFIAKWILEYTMFKAVRILNFLGVVVFVLSLALLIMSVPWMRRDFYRGFYIVHTVTAWSFVILIIFHARPGVTDLGIVSLILLSYQVVQRFFLSKTCQILEIKADPLSSLSVIRLSKPPGFAHPPGSHIRISLSRFNLFTSTHPYSIATLPDETDLVLIATRTRFVREMAAETQCTIIGPFPSLQPHLFTHEDVSIVAGGSGISACLPLLRYFPQANLSWYVRNEADLFIIKALNWAPSNNITVYLTGQRDSIQPSENDQEDSGLLGDIELGDLALEDFPQFPEYDIKVGKPPVSSVLGDGLIIACGPATLIEEARKTARSRGALFHSELYAM